MRISKPSLRDNGKTGRCKNMSNRTSPDITPNLLLRAYAAGQPLEARITPEIYERSS